MELIKIKDSDGNIHYINVNFITAIFDRGDQRFVSTTNKDVCTNEPVSDILQKIKDAEK